MAKDVDNIEFWENRINRAAVLHHSVFVVSGKEWQRIEREHLKIIHEHIEPDDNVLDAGCGYGRMAEYFDNYTGVDFSPDFIRLAREKHLDKDFFVMDLKNMQFHKKEFDWAFCISIKRMIIDNCGLKEWQAMEKELKRIAKKVLILEYGSPEKYEIV